MPFAEFILKTCRYVTAEVAVRVLDHPSYHNLQTREHPFTQVAPLSWTVSRTIESLMLPDNYRRHAASSQEHGSLGHNIRNILSRFRSAVVAPSQETGNKGLYDPNMTKDHQEVEEEADDDDDDDDADELLYFRPVLESLDVEKLEQVATILDEFLKMTCEISHKPWGGLENLVFSITFSDGVIWIARIPGHGTEDRFNQLDAQNMESEYQTMSYIRAHTTIPIPEVFYWNTSVGLVGTQFALMAFVEGKPLGTSWMLEYSDQQRLDMLSQISGFMAQLRNLSFDKIGMLDFEADGEVKGVRSEILLYSRMFRPWETTVEHPAHHTLLEALWHKFDEMEVQETNARSKASWAILRMMLSSMPGTLTKETQFTLSPPDFKFWDIFIDDKGLISGFIDWDGVHTEASCTGSARFPAWICSDWDPASYAYDEEAPLEGQSKYWSSPEDLSRYRQHHAAAMASRLADHDAYDRRMTTLSHIVECLKKAITDSMSRGACTSKLLEHAFNGRCPFELHQYADDYVAGDCTKKDAMIRTAAEKMWRPKWEEPEE